MSAVANEAQLPDGVRRVAAALAERGHPHAPILLDTAARTAQQAADALGVGVGQIAKSIVFRRLADDAAVLVVTSGDRRVDEGKVAARVGALGKADAAFVKAATSFAIGGVAPVGHAKPPVMLIDRELFRFDDGEGRQAAAEVHLDGDFRRFHAGEGAAPEDGERHDAGKCIA